MKALVLQEYNNLVYTDVPEPTIGRDDVLIKVKACAICGSDVHGLDGSTGRRIPPVIMGHEAAGAIEAVGAGVNDCRPGDRVTFDSTIFCGTCCYCAQGRVNLCDHRRVLGVSCQEYRQNGAFAEYVAVPRRILMPLPVEVTFERAAMVEPLAIALHAVHRSPVALNANAVVVGTGTIGLLLVQILKAAGCAKVIAVDLDEGKLEQAARFGATDCLLAKMENVPAVIAKITGGRGADAAFEAVGAAASFKTAVACLRKGGALTLVGNLASQIDLPLQLVVTREISLHGSCASAGEYEACLDLIARGAVDVDSLIGAVAPLSEGAAWFDRLYKEEPGLGKVVLVP